MKALLAGFQVALQVMIIVILMFDECTTDTII